MFLVSFPSSMSNTRVTFGTVFGCWSSAILQHVTSGLGQSETLAQAHSVNVHNNVISCEALTAMTG